MIKYFIPIIILILFSGCTRKAAVEDPIVAKIGNTVITVSEFKKNYEFGLSHLKQGDNPKKTYLDYMIKERVLAQAGYQSGRDTSTAVQRARQRLEQELLIEELFYDQVHRKIKITDDEIKAALNKSKVSWKFRYWVEPTFEGAQIVARAMRERGYADVVTDFLNQHPETPLSPRNFESDFVSWLDVPDALLNGLKDLPRGEISAPIELNSVYYIIQITNIRQQGILESEYASKAASIQKILFYRKVLQEGFQYVANFLTPKQIVTKGEPFRILADALAEWRKIGTGKSLLNAIQSASDEQKALLTLKNNLSETLVQFNGGNWSVAEFVKDKLDTTQLTANPDDLNAFRNQLNNLIGLSIRNYFLLNEARKKGLDRSANVQKQLAEWQDKWVYQETRYACTRGLKLNPDQIKNYFENNKSKYKIRKDTEPTFEEFKAKIKQDAYLSEAKKLLNAKIDSLLHYFPVEINKSVLDTITVQTPQKSKWMSVQLFKKSSNRLAFPIVDPAWGF